MGERFQQGRNSDSEKSFRIVRKILSRTPQQRPSPSHIPRRVMMKRDRNLNEPLKKLLFPPVRLAPHIFPNFMGFVKFLVIEQPNSATVSVRIHVARG